MEEIGQRAGVSRSTVSRVLNDHPDVRAEVRSRVNAVIAETGYRPNPAARALVSNRSGLIGLVILTDVDELFGDPYFPELVSGIQEGCAEHDLIFTIFPIRGDDGRSDTLVSQITRGMVDGVIITAGPHSDELIVALRDRGVRVVVVGQPADERGLLRVDVENRVGSRGAVRHLIDHGAQPVGFVGTTPEYLYGVERLAGYREALVEAGLGPDDRLVCLDLPGAAGGYRATTRLLEEQPGAIFVATDPMAVGAYRAIADAGLRVPDDIAVVGFDGLPRGPQLDPALTTVVQPVAAVGRTAVGLLAGDQDGVEPILLPTELRVGASCPRAGIDSHADPAAGGRP